MVLTQLLKSKHDQEANEQGQVGAQTRSILGEDLEEHYVDERAAGETLQDGRDQTGSSRFLAVID